MHPWLITQLAVAQQGLREGWYEAKYEGCDVGVHKSFLDLWSVYAFDLRDQTKLAEMAFAVLAAHSRRYVENDFTFFFDECAPSYALAAYVTTKSMVLQQPHFYSGLEYFIQVAAFHQQRFFENFGMTPDQVMYANSLVAHRVGLKSE